MSEDPFASTNSFFTPEPRSISFAVEEDPWSSGGFDPVDVIRQPLVSSTTNMEESLLTEGITAANALGKMFFFMFSCRVLFIIYY